MTRTAFLLGVGVCVLVFGPLAVKAAEDELRVLQVENARLRATLATRDKQVEDLKMEVAGLKGENAKLVGQANALRDEVKLLRQNIAEVNARLRSVGVVPPQTATPADQSASPAPAAPSAAPPPSLDKWAGFRGLKWAANIADAPGMILVEDGVYKKYYRREGDKLAIGGAELKRIVYGFYKARFCWLYIQTQGFLNWSALKDAVFAIYGKGYQPNQYIDRWYWGGSFTAGVKDVTMCLEYNKFSEESKLLMDYEPIRAEEKAEEAKKAKEASKDF